MAFSWFAVDNSVTDHPKVMRLEAVLSEPLALAYVVRLWSWAQKYAPDGRIDNAIASQLERATGWRGPEGDLISALVEVGLLDSVSDGFEVHDWSEHQGALVAKSKRDADLKRRQRRQNGAKTARAGRQNGAKTAPAQDRTGQDTTEHDTTEPKAFSAGEVMTLWNEGTRPPIPKALKMEGARLTMLNRRLREHPDAAFWVSLVATVDGSDFLAGRKNDFKATLDWVLNPTNLGKILEGNYSNSGPVKASMQQITTWSEGDDPLVGLGGTR